MITACRNATAGVLVTSESCLAFLVRKNMDIFLTQNKNKQWLRISALVLCMLLISCAQVRITPPEVELAGVEISDISLTHVNLNAQIRIFNPNRHAIRVGAVNYEMELNGDRVFSSVTYVDDSVEPGESIIVPLRISSAFWDIIRMFSRLGTRQELDFRLAGSVEAGSSTGGMKYFDFERSGKLDLSSPDLNNGQRKNLLLKPGQQEI